MRRRRRARLHRRRRLSGIVTDRDLVVRCLAEGRNGETPLREIYSSDVTTLTPDSSIDDAVSLMKDPAVRRIPVVENDDLVASCRSAISRASASPIRRWAGSARRPRPRASTEEEIVRSTRASARGEGRCTVDEMDRAARRARVARTRGICCALAASSRAGARRCAGSTSPPIATRFAARATSTPTRSGASRYIA